MAFSIHELHKLTYYNYSFYFTYKLTYYLTLTVSILLIIMYIYYIVFIVFIVLVFCCFCVIDVIVPLYTIEGILILYWGFNPSYPTAYDIYLIYKLNVYIPL